MPLCIVDERQQRRRPVAAAPLRLRPAGPLAVLLAPYIPHRVCSSLAPCQRAWGPAAKCTPYFLTGPKTRKRKESRSFGCGRAVPCSSVVFIHTRPKLRGARGGSRFFSRCRGLLRAVENLIRVNSWNSWPKKAATNCTNFTKNDHCPLDVIGLKCNFSQSLRPR